MLNYLKQYITPLNGNKDAVVCYLLKIPAINSSIEENFLKLLSLEEKCRARNFYAQNSKFQFIYSRVILREILKIYLGKEPAIEIGAHGKPFISNGDFQFSISHSSQFLAIAISNRSPVGVDIEEIKKIPELSYIRELYSKPNVFDPIQDKSCRSGLVNFYLAWTKGEAIQKALGKGADPAYFNSQDSKEFGNMSIFQDIFDESYAFAIAFMVENYFFENRVIRIEYPT